MSSKNNEEDKEYIVRNFEFFDSDEEEDNNLEDFDDYDGYDTADDETEEYCDALNKLLSDVADVETLGLKVFKINFHDTRIKELEDKKTECDFDYDDDGMPIMLDGGEQFIIPYLVVVSKKITYYKNCIFETNINKKFTL